MARCGILKQVQDDHQLCSVVLCSYVTSHRSQLIAHNSLLKICVISVPLKILYKTVFLYKSSWKVESAQLENFYFPVGKSKFRSRSILGDFLGLFLNYFKQFLFILKPMSALWTKVKMFDSER